MKRTSQTYEIENIASFVLSDGDMDVLAKHGIEPREGGYTAEELLCMLPHELSDPDNTFILDVWPSVIEDSERVWTVAYVPDYGSIDTDVELVEFTSRSMLEAAYNMVLWAVCNSIQLRYGTAVGQ